MRSIKPRTSRRIFSTNVAEIETNEAVTAVRGLKLRTLDGKEFRAHGRYYVLATGGIETPPVCCSCLRPAWRPVLATTMTWSGVSSWSI